MTVLVVMNRSRMRMMTMMMLMRVIGKITKRVLMITAIRCKVHRC